MQILLNKVRFDELYNNKRTRLNESEAKERIMDIYDRLETFLPLRTLVWKSTFAEKFPKKEEFKIKNIFQINHID